MRERAVLFIDGNNWYHGLRSIGLADLGRLDYAKVSRKLVGPTRDWIRTRYYVGRVNQAEAPRLYADQRRFLAGLAAADPRITHHLGRLETRVVANEAADELLRMLNALPTRIDVRVYKNLLALAHRHHRVSVKVEKAVDVMMAVDMVSLALKDEFDAAYLLSADGDLTPAVAEVRGVGKKVFVAAPIRGAQLASVANAYLRVDVGWFGDCW
jgi:uncharacterized LabA/DUF88 family protein